MLVLKDQKIIDLMLTRHEEAQQLRSDKMALDLAWDDQRRLENELRESRVKQRNAELYEQLNAKDIKQVKLEQSIEMIIKRSCKGMDMGKVDGWLKMNERTKERSGDTFI